MGVKSGRWAVMGGGLSFLPLLLGIQGVEEAFPALEITREIERSKQITRRRPGPVLPFIRKSIRSAHPAF